MRDQRNESETYHLMCMVCGALPGMTCVDSDFHELPQVHPSRRISISERNWRSLQGWDRQSCSSSAASAGNENPHGPPCSIPGSARTLRQCRKHKGEAAGSPPYPARKKPRRSRESVARRPGYRGTEKDNSPDCVSRTQW